MKFETTRDAIEHARQFHLELSKFYHTLGSQTGEERTRLLLEYLSRHERNVEHQLAACEHEATADVLDSWFQNQPDETNLLPLYNFEFDPEMDCARILEVAIDEDNRMADFFRELADTSPCTKVKDLFNAICNLEQNQKFHLSKNAQMIYEL